MRIFLLSFLFCLGGCGLSRSNTNSPATTNVSQAGVGASGSSGIGVRALDAGNGPGLGIVTPGAAPLIACSQTLVSLKPGQTLTLSWALNPAQNLRFNIVGDDGKIGTVVQKSQLEATYAAPASLATGRVVEVRATSVVNPAVQASCSVKVLGDNEVFGADVGQRGLVGQVYPLTRGTATLPNLDTLPLKSTVVVANLDVPTGSFRTGFPGVPNLVEWFAIRFRGRLTVTTAGLTRFKIVSDDGSKLYLNGSVVIDNDGTHSTTAKEGSVSLVAGDADLKVEYFQGPADQIALQLYWMPVGSSAFVVVPPEAIKRPI